MINEMMIRYTQLISRETTPKSTNKEVMESITDAQISLEVELQDWRQYFQLISRIDYLNGVQSVVRKPLARDTH